MLNINKGLLVAVILLLFTCQVFAHETVAPPTIDGSTLINAEGLINIVSELEDLVIIDARIAMDRRVGFIEGSESLPDSDTNCESLAKIIPTIATPVAFYCNGPKCGRSVVSVKVARECGYQNIYWFRGGFEEWQAKAYPFLKE